MNSAVRTRPELATRMDTLPAYVFQDLARELERRRAAGADIIVLGMSDPDLPPPRRALLSLTEAVHQADAHRYPPYPGTRALREAVAGWYQRRFHVTLDPDHEILITQGSKEVLVHLALALTNPHDVVLVPDPGYPAYLMAGALFGAANVPVPLRLEGDGGPDFDAVPPDALRRARLLYVNYPNNPAGCLAPAGLYEELSAWAMSQGMVIVSDLAYADLVYDGQATSLLAVEEARPWCLETVTWSKTYSMQGWRVGALAGDARLVAAVARIEANINAGVFLPIQAGAVSAIAEPLAPKILARYRTRRDRAVRILAEAGLPVRTPPAGVYLFVRAPGCDGTAYARAALERGVAVTPGAAFGPHGHAYVRISLTHPDERLEEGIHRLVSH
ncbi:MAG: aminotransferase class I/II-fold pyridoxal phosphate-dependent enzyme [Clostridia bacterium]